MPGIPDTVGVIGAGTMGGGIAQLAALAGARTIVHDPLEGALERGLQAVRDNLQRGARRERWSAQDADAATGRLEAAATLDDLGTCGLVIEAAPERLELKRELFAALGEVVDPGCVLATNTSSIPVTAIASAAARPERVVGMHFFNPPPLMRLVEVVGGLQSGAEALAVADATGEAMGRQVIRATDTPGFLVNRCNRPWNLEALRCVSERLATIEQVDRICRMAGGFRMGPFQLMDFGGVDVGFDVARSFYELSFGEPRWRPSPLWARQVASGRLGRKTGHGWYEHPGERPVDPEPPAAGGGDGLVVIAGDLVLADELRAAAADAGWEVREPEDAAGEVPALIVDCGQDPEAEPLQGGPRAVLCAEGSLAVLDPGGGAVGFHALAPLASGRLVELTRGPDSAPAAARAAEGFFSSLGRHVEWVGDAPGLVLGRIVAQIANEAAFALGEGVGSAPDIDAGMRLGLNHPRGPLAWADETGVDHVLAIVDALCDEYREERYRAAPALRRLALGGRLGRATGAGFHAYDTG